MKIFNVVGARPNFMKMAPLMDEMKAHPEMVPVLVHTGQHYDYRMSKIFFQDLDLPEPDIYLGVGSGSHAEQTAKIMVEFEKACILENPDLVVVVGDVNSTLACSLAAAKLLIPVAHIEAGLRSFDRTMPEEINRIMTDTLSEYLFTTCKEANDNLLREGAGKEKIFFVGNIMIDALVKNRTKFLNSKISNKLGIGKKEYAVLTLHRPSNVNDKMKFLNLMSILKKIQGEIPIVFPMHPRTEKKALDFGIIQKIKELKNIKVMPPLGYLDFINLIYNSRFTLTDSGGIQEETTFLGIPCLTLRENTERPITVDCGTNTIVGSNRKRILSGVKKILDDKYKKSKIPTLWDGRTSERIIKVLLGKK